MTPLRPDEPTGDLHKGSPRTLIALMHELQTRGEFTYGDLAEGLVRKLGIPLLVAQRSVLQVAEMHGPLAEDDMIDEPAPPTIAETIAKWKAMAAALKPKSMRDDTKRLWLGPRNTTVAIELFEHYRPKHSPAKWLRDAPNYVVSCYDNAANDDRYIVVFGGSLWTAEYAHANWQSGLNPHLAPCLRMSGDPVNGISIWTDCLRTRRLGVKICWNELPTRVRDHVKERVARLITKD
jgi:hypothetical protein